MNEIIINEKISYIEASENPLSADIGIIRDNGITWLYDVGNGDNKVDEPNQRYNVVLSHFHKDHTGNIEKIQINELFVSKETFKHIHKGTIVRDSILTGNLHIFPLPSSHTQGCLGLEIDNTYAFVGDALYCKAKDGFYIYNAQLLKEEIDVLKSLCASFLLVSHFDGLVRKKDDVIDELEMIYKMREKNNPYIKIKIEVE